MNHYEHTGNGKPLSDREREVLTALSNGLSQKEIGSELYIAPATVNTHVQNIYYKLEVHNSASAVGKAIRTGVID